MAPDTPTFDSILLSVGSLAPRNSVGRHAAPLTVPDKTSYQLPFHPLVTTTCFSAAFGAGLLVTRWTARDGVHSTALLTAPAVPRALVRTRGSESRSLAQPNRAPSRRLGGDDRVLKGQRRGRQGQNRRHQQNIRTPENYLRTSTVSLLSSVYPFQSENLSDSQECSRRDLGGPRHTEKRRESRVGRRASTYISEDKAHLVQSSNTNFP